MSQVSLLSVDVGQTSELQGGKGDVRIKSQANTSSFSDAMEQHYPPQKAVELNDKNKQTGNFASKAAKLEQQTFNRDGSIKQDKLTKPSEDADMLPLPLPIEDDALTVKVPFKDGADSLPVPIQVVGDLLTTKPKSKGDADILPVPLPIEGDLLTTKAKSKGDADILPVPLPIENDLLTAKTQSKGDTAIMPVSPFKETGSTIEQPSKALPGDINSTNPAVKTTHESNTHAQAQPQLQTAQTASVLVNQAEHDDSVDLLNMLYSAGKLIIKASSEQASLEQSGKSTTTKTEPLLASHQRISASNSLSAGQELLTKAVKAVLSPSPSSTTNSKGDNIPLGNNTNQVLTANADEKTAESVSRNLFENAPGDDVANTVKSAVRSAIASDVMSNMLISGDNNALTLEQEDVLDAKLLAKQTSVETLKQSSHLATEQNIKQSFDSNEKAQKSESDVDEFNLKAAKQITPAELNLDHKATGGERSEAKVQDGKVSNPADFRQLNDNEPAKIRSVNQSTHSVIANSSIELKVDTHQKIVSNEASDKPTGSGADVEKLMKAESEKLAPQADKTASVFNQTLDAQAAKPIASSGELAAQQEQSFESAINKLTTNTVQTQKSITAVNTETIAIYRKDFADAVKDKVMVMINQKIQQVEIQLDPPEMGNIHVRVNLQNEQAAVQFVVQNQQAKEALEQNMAKLRDMLAENGVDVGDASIEQRQAKEHNGNGLNSGNKDGESGDLAEDNSHENDSSILNMVKASSTGIDYYA